MTKLAPDERCSSCGSLLVPPELASRFQVPVGTDYMCLKCGRPYRWTKGNPPRLVTFAAIERAGSDDEDES